MQIADPLGVPGAPLETLQAVLTHLEGANLTGGRLILVRDRQGDRGDARYGAVVTLGNHAVVTVPAFGPHYGRAGAQALAELTRWAGERGMPVREAAVNPADLTRILGEPDPGEVLRVIAASNPSDPAIYTALPPRRPDEDDWEA
ncbi:DUF3197 domain-containing protein [Deinococcus planocerae]|uniref:DUF3197 domain-containing protein n=1 Tax=Deinococcus planocerae TaxID=1737569 RepID=UPI000C7EF0A7|nr:DUF3197 domain-containing protein [Deinococcus planocerae]